MKATIGRTAASALMLVASVALAQPSAAQGPVPVPGPGPGTMTSGPGPGMMGGYGPGAGRGYGRGQGMGPGMAGGCGYGPVDGMGGAMMGPGMMGPGMMGPGMMMGGGVGRVLWSLDLDEAQRKEILKIGDELRKKHWTVAGHMHDEMAKMRDAGWAAGKRDRAAILAAHKRMSELRQQQLEASLDAAERIEKVLTAEQRERLGRVGPWWMMGGAQ